MNPPRARRRRRNHPLLGRLGPGLITGAADDDPGGIATYSQAGAQLGANVLWTMALAYPLMVAIQLISARIGRVTGRGLAANLVRVFPRPVVGGLVALLFVANTFNIGADIAAMGAASQLVFGGDAKVFTLVLAILSLTAQMFVPYHRYVHVLKWLTMSLFAYVGVVFTVRIDWSEVGARLLAPHLAISAANLTVIVAVLGTTISPYLYFWQSSEEVEELQNNHQRELLHARRPVAERELARIRWDTFIGMAFANMVAFFIMLTTAVTLHVHGVTDIQTSAQAASALQPIAGRFAFLLFSLGIIGTGLLATPVLAGSAAYAVAEWQGWKCGLEHWPWEARGFYAVVFAAMLLGLVVVFSPLDPIKALFWSAVLNGVISAPIMAAMMVVGSQRHEMGRFVTTFGQRMFGWAATIVMTLVVGGLLVLQVAS